MEQRVFGQPVTADDVESMRVSWGTVRLAQLGNALIQRALVRAGMPSATLRTTERINVPDGGIDAECRLPDSVPETGGLVGPGRTIYQFKYRDARRGRKAGVSELVRALRQDVPRIDGEYDRYVLLTNLDLTSTDSRRLVKAASPELPGASRPVIVWHAADIARNLNVNPDLRHLFFGAGSLSTLQVAENELKADYRDLGWPAFVDRQAQMAAIKGFVAGPAGRFLRVLGPRYAGKSRLVIEALKCSAPTAIWAESPDAVSLDLLRDLDTIEEPPVLVVDRCDGVLGSRVIEWAQERERLRTIAIQQGPPGSPTPDRTEIRVAELAAEHARQLLTATRPGVGFARTAWVLENSGGLPGLLLHLARLVRLDLRPAEIPPEDVEQQVGDLLAREYEDRLRLDPETCQALEIAAVLPLVGVGSEAGKDLEAVSRALGRDADILHKHLSRLERLGLVRHRGRLIEVVPPVLADHYAARVLDAPGRIAALTAILEPAPFLLFLDRLSHIPARGLDRAAPELLDAWCRDLDTLLAHIDKVSALAAAAPVAALRGLTRGLEPLTIAELRERVRADARRTLVRTLEALALRTDTFEGAATLLLRLAEAENDRQHRVSATHVFVSLFHWWHDLIPVPLATRLRVLRHGAQSERPDQRRLIAGAAGRSLPDVGLFTYRTRISQGLPEPEYRPRTWEDVGAYAAGILDVIRRLLEDTNASVRDTAASAVLDATPPAIEIAVKANDRPPGLVGRAVEMLAQEASRRAEPLQAMESLRRLEELSRRLAALSRDGLSLATTARDEVAVLQHSLTTRSLAGRLAWWVGPAVGGRPHGGSRRGEFLAALDAIAADLVEHPDQFEQHLDWLTGTEARSATDLFRALGKRDAGGSLLAALLARRQGATWPARFASYFEGWAAFDLAAAAQRLDLLLEQSPELTEALLRALPAVGDALASTGRLQRLIRTSPLPRPVLAALVARLVPWEDLPNEAAEQVMRDCDDHTSETRGPLLTAFVIRLTRGAALSAGLRQLAWGYLRSSFAVPGTYDRFDWDDVASLLGEDEPQRLLSLLEDLAPRRGIVAERTPWSRELPQIWQTLIRGARAGLVKLLVTLAARADTPGEFAHMLEELLEPDLDLGSVLDSLGQHIGAARVVASALDAGRPGFWELARALVERCGGDETVKERLTSAALAGSREASPLDRIELRIQEARVLAKDSNSSVAAWGGEVAAELEVLRLRATRGVTHTRGEDAEDWIWDYRIRRVELEGMVNGPDSPERRWAIGRLLKDAPEERVRELLSPDDILEALPTIEDLDAGKRRRWEAWGRHYRSRPH